LQETRTVKVWVEKVFRGKKFDKPIQIELSSHKPDFKLLSKKEEASYCTPTTRQETILPYDMELPPLLREFVEKETGKKDARIKIHHKNSTFNNTRFAKKGEEANVEITMGLGKPHPIAMGLYQGVDL
jgi:small subunit ribosomal protein S34